MQNRFWWYNHFDQLCLYHDVGSCIPAGLSARALKTKLGGNISPLDHEWKDPDNHNQFYIPLQVFLSSPKK